MPYVEIDQEIYDSLEPEFKGKLKLYTPEDTTGLKDKANALLSEKKTLELSLAQSNADLKAAKIAKPNEGGSEDAIRLQSQLDDAVNKLGDWETKYNGLQSDIKNKSIESEASRIAATMTTDTKRAQLLQKEILSRLSLDGDNFSVLDEKGNQTISSIEELTGQIKTQYPFLVDGSQASGGGAQGGSGGAMNKPISEMTMTERAKFANEKPLEYSKQVGA